MSLFQSVVAKTRARALSERMGGTFEAQTITHQAAAQGAGLVRMGNQIYDAATTQQDGALAVKNAGRPAAAVYVPSSGGSIIVRSGGSGSTSGGSIAPIYHNQLLGLANSDDHPQYLNTLRGDARYVPLDRMVSGTAPIFATPDDGRLDQDVQIGLRIATNSGLTTTGSPTGLALGAPSTSTVSSANSVATSSHTHAITSSSNPGAAASLLASDASGFLSLVRLITTDRIRTPLIDTAGSYLTIQPSNSVTYFPAPGAIGMGTSTPARKLHIEDTTGAQMRLSYNLTNYMDFLVDSGGSWRIAPTGDIIVDPLGDDMRPLRNYAIRLGLDTSKYLSLHVAELIADTFVAEEVRSTIGGKIFVSPTTSLTRDLDAAALVYDTIAQRGTTTTALGSFTPAGYSTITQRGTTTTATGNGGGFDGTPLFSATFESGDLTDFDSTSDTATSTTFEAAAGAAKTGSYGMRIVSAETSDVGTQARGRLDFSWPASDILCVEWWWRRDYDSVTGYNNNTIAKAYFSINSSGGGELVSANRANGAWNLCYMNTSFSRVYLDSWTPTDDTWYKFRLVLDRTAATAAVYFGRSTDGETFTAIYDDYPSASNLSSTEPAYGLFGHVHITQWEKSTYAEDWDDIAGYSEIPTSSGDTEIAVNKPTGVTDGDLLIARVAYTGGTLTPPSGWTSVLAQAGTGINLAVYQKTAASEPATYTWALDAANPMALDTSAYYNVDASDPIAAYDAQANASSTSMIAPTITPATTADMLLFAGAVAADVRATAPSGMSEDSDTGITGVGIYGADQLLASGSATGTRTATLASAAANVGALVSLRPIYNAASGASATIAPPTGTTTDDVMIAIVAYTGGTLTPASGWTSVLAQAATGVSLAIYRRTAGGAEGNSVWSLNTTDALAVAISAYDNIDTGAPLDIYSGQANASSTSMIAPSVSITSPSSRLIFAGAVAADARATAPSGMGEDADTGQTGVGIYMADQAMSSAGATGTRTATLASAAANAAALVALRPSSTPGGSTPTTIYTKHNNLNNGDRVILEARLQVEFMAVTSTYTEITPGEEYSYTVTRNLDGTGANSWIAGDAVASLGQTGNGWIELYARYGMPRSGQGAYNRVGPTIVGNVRKSATFNDFREHWAIGNLNGLYDFSSNIYGAAFGDPTQTWISLDNRSHTLGGGLRFMNNLAEVGYIRNNATWRFNGNANNYIQWNGTNLEVRGTIVVTGTFSGVNYAGSSTAGGAANSITGQGALATANSAAWGSQVSGRPVELTDDRIPIAIAAGGILQSRFDPATNWGANPGAGYAGLLIGADYMGYWTGSAWRTFLQNNGNFYFGGSSGAHIRYDSTANRLQGVNSGGTTQWYADGSTGEMLAGAGAVRLNANGIRLLSSQSAYANVNAYQIMNYAGDTVMGGLYGYEGSSSFGQFVRVYVTNTNRPSNLVLNAITNSATYPANVGIISQSGASTARIDIEGVAGIDITGATSIEGTLTILGGTLLVPSDATIGGSWTTLTLTSPWTNNGSGWATAQYCRFGDWVMIKGLVTPSSNASANATILTLPSAIRPSENRRFSGIAASASANLDVLSTGVVRVSLAVNTGQVASIECTYKL